MKSKSYWEDINYLEKGSNEKPKDSDVLVVGSGFAGLSTALHLAEAGMKVTLVGKSEKGSFSKNAGHVLVGMGESYNRLIESKGRQRAKDLMNLGLFVNRIFKDSMEAFGADIKYGGYRIIPYNDTEKQEMIDSNRLLVEDGFTPYGVRNDSFYCPYSGFGDPLKFRNNLMLRSSLVNNLDIKIYEAEVSYIEKSSEGYNISYKDNPYKTKHDVVVLASNAFLDWDDKVIPFKGQILASEPLNLVEPYHMANYAFSSEQGSLYGQVTVGGRLLIGGWRNHVRGGEMGSYNLTPNKEITKGLQSVADRIFSKKIKNSIKWEYEWCGIMGSTDNGLPIITQRRSDGVYVCAGFNGYGFGMGYGYGKIMADIILGNPVPKIVLECMRGV